MPNRKQQFAVGYEAELIELYSHAEQGHSRIFGC